MRNAGCGVGIVATAARRVGRWMVGLPAERPVGRVRRWSWRMVGAMCVGWLFAFGPLGVVAPRWAGFSVAAANDVTIYYQDRVPRKVVEDAVACAVEGRARNLAFWGEPSGGVRPIDIYLCSSRARWQELTLWASGGNACTVGSRIFISPLTIWGKGTMGQLIAHEMSHAFLNQRIGYLRAMRVPAWVNEGLATVVGQNFWASDVSVKSALEQMGEPQLVAATDLSSHLDWACAFKDGRSVSLAYGHARSLCTDLIERYGAERMKAYLERAKLAGGEGEAFRAAFGMEMTKVDERWLAESQRAGRVPARTVLVEGHRSTSIVALFMLPYLLLAVACCRVGGRAVRGTRFLMQRWPVCSFILV